MAELKKALIVDDEESILRLLSLAMKVDGLVTITASKIEEAEYAIKNCRIDLVIADIRLSGVLGREGLMLLSYIKDKSPGTKVVVMTGFGSPEIEAEAYERGAYSYLEKPIDLRALREILAGLNLPPAGAGKRVMP